MKLQMKKTLRNKSHCHIQVQKGKSFKFLFNNNTTIHISRVERNLAHKIPSKYLIILLIQYTVYHLECKKKSKEMFSTIKDILVYCMICEKIKSYRFILPKAAIPKNKPIVN